MFHVCVFVVPEDKLAKYGTYFSHNKSKAMGARGAASNTKKYKYKLCRHSDIHF